MEPLRVRSPTVTRAVFFAFGGTLAEQVSDILLVCQAVAHRTGLWVSWKEFLRENNRPWEGLWPDAPT
jgi:hypothetical protein